MLSEDHLQRLEILWRESTQGSWYTHDGVELMARETGPVLRLRDWNEDLESDEDPLPPEKRFTPEFSRRADAQFSAQVHNAWPDLLAEIHQVRAVLAELEAGDWLESQVVEILEGWHGPADSRGRDNPEAWTLVEQVVDRIVAQLRAEKGA